MPAPVQYVESGLSCKDHPFRKIHFARTIFKKAAEITIKKEVADAAIRQNRIPFQPLSIVVCKLPISTPIRNSLTNSISYI